MRFLLKVYFITVLAFISTIVLAKAGDKLPKSPFAVIPLDQQNYVVSSVSAVKPNLLFFIDDSGSMDWTVPTDTGPQKKIDVTKDALKSIVNDARFKDSFNWNIYTLWGSESGDDVQKGIEHKFSDAQTMLGWINNLTPRYTTPATSRYLEVANIVKKSIDLVCRKNYIIMMSDGDANYENNDDYRGKDFGKYAGTPSAEYEFNGIKSREYDASGNLLQEGDGISYFSRQLFMQDIKTAADGVDKEGTGWDDGVAIIDKQGNSVVQYTKQNIITYTVGFGDGLSANGKKYLENAASLKNGSDGKYYFQADSGGDLQSAFETIVSKAYQNNKGIGGLSVSISSPGLVADPNSPDSLVGYLALDSNKWSSTLKFAKLDGNGNIVMDASGKAVLEEASFNNRKIIVNDGSRNYFFNDNQLTGKFFDIKEEQEFKLGFSPWYRRDSTLSDKAIEQAVANAVPANLRTVEHYRERTGSAQDGARMMGDVLGSPLVAMGKENSGRPKYIATASNDGMVYFFKNIRKNGTPYDLVLNYLPAAMQREGQDDTVAKTIKVLAEKGYGTNNNAEIDNAQTHIYLNNGGIQWRKTSSNGGKTPQMTFLAGAMGEGGRGAYLLNVSGKSRIGSNLVGLDADSSTWDKTVPLWETSKDNNQLGYTVSTPQIGLVALNRQKDSDGNYTTVDKNAGIRQYIFLANGYQANNKNLPYDAEPTLYIYEALGEEMGTSGAVKTGDSPGTLVKKISVTGGYGGLSTPRLVDTDLDGVFDYAYAGDQGGNVYRFSFLGPVSNWSVVKIYQGKGSDSNSPEQPIITRPSVYRNSATDYIVLVGTGSNIYQSDLSNKQQQVMLGIFDDLSNLSPKVITQSDMTQQTIDTVLTATVDGQQNKLRYVSNNLAASGARGWYLLLDQGNGERVVTDSDVLLSTVYFTTTIYETVSDKNGQTQQVKNKETCLPNTQSSTTISQSWLMSLDLKTGGSPDSDSSYLDNFPNNNNQIVSGIQLIGISSGVNAFSPDEEESAINSNGGGESGEDGLVPPPNNCVNYDTYSALLADQSGAASYKLKVKICQPSKLIRLNVNELIL